MDSPETVYWLNPIIEAFRRPLRIKQEIQLSQQDLYKPRRARGHKVYIQEEGSFLFPNFVIALKNKFDVLSNNNNLIHFKNDYNNNNDIDFDDYDVDFDDENILLESIPDFENTYSKNKNLCSGYFCSFIPLINNNKSLNIPIYNKKHKKQISNKFGKYNKEYVTKMNRRCIDIVNKFFNDNYSKKRLQKRHKGSGPMINTTQGCSSSGLHISTTPGCNGSGPKIDTTPGCRGSGPKMVTTQGCKGSGPILNTTQGCKGSGPRTYIKQGGMIQSQNQTLTKVSWSQNQNIY